VLFTGACPRSTERGFQGRINCGDGPNCDDGGPGTLTADYSAKGLPTTPRETNHPNAGQPCWSQSRAGAFRTRGERNLGDLLKLSSLDDDDMAELTRSHTRSWGRLREGRNYSSTRARNSSRRTTFNAHSGPGPEMSITIGAGALVAPSAQTDAENTRCRSWSIDRLLTEVFERRAVRAHNATVCNRFCCAIVSGAMC